MDYSVTLEWLSDDPAVAVLRVHEGDGALGDPYVWACTVAETSAYTATLKGVISAPPGADACRAMKRALRLAGFRRYTIERIRPGRRLDRTKTL